MTQSPDDTRLFEILQTRLSTLLPDSYQSPTQDVQPVSMGSAALKFNPDGTVAWNEIWGSFCHLAMAGGPPHKGTLLEPGTYTEIHADPGRHRQVMDEICRGIHLAAGLDAEPSRAETWVRVDCLSEAMAGWLTRTIVMENVSTRCQGAVLFLPAGPAYRLEKEIKNVVTVIAKTCHYWRDHMRPARQQAIAGLFVEMNRDHPLLQPALPGFDFQPGSHHAREIHHAIQSAIPLALTHHAYAGWLGLDCRTVSAAICMMRLLVAANLLSRREETTVFLPVNPVTDPGGRTVVQALAKTYRLASARKLF